MNIISSIPYQKINWNDSNITQTFTETDYVSESSDLSNITGGKTNQRILRWEKYSNKDSIDWYIKFKISSVFIKFNINRYNNFKLI